MCCNLPFSIPLVNASLVLLFLGISGVLAHLQNNSPPSPSYTETQENHLIYLKLGNRKKQSTSQTNILIIYQLPAMKII